MGRYGFIILFLVILAAPLALHAIYKPSAQNAQTGGLRLVIITPNGQEIRDGLRAAFADWSKKNYGEAIELQFLTPGGTTDIRRQLDTISRAILPCSSGLSVSHDADRVVALSRR